MISLVIILAVLSLVMIPLEARWPALPNQPRFRRGWRLDLVYWFFTTLITTPVSRVVVAIVLFPVLKLSGAGTFEKLLEGFGPLGHQPRLDQALQMIVLIDFVGYWLHRWFHSQRLWRFHAIHHSSVDLDWLSAARVHPVNDIVNKAIEAAVVVSLGYSPLLLAGVLPFFLFYAILQHANVTWDFGPLRKIFASPKFHRWHHTSAQEGQDKNFAGLLPLWDILFGTYYMPEHQPNKFGVDDAVPNGLVGQMVWPFRKSLSSLGKVGAFIVVLHLLIAPTSGWADSWPAARPFQVFSESAKYFVRVIPGDSIGDTVGFAGARKGQYAQARYYALQGDRSYKLLHEIKLQNPVAPVDLLLSDHGYFIAFDNWHNLGHGKVAAIYAPTGKPLRSYELDQLYGAALIEKIPTSVSSRHWRCQPIHFVEPKEQKSVYVPEALGGYFVFTLASGAMHYAAGARKECVAPSGPMSQTRHG